MILIRGLLVTVPGRNHHAFDSQLHDKVEELTHFGRIDPFEKGRVRSDTETAFDRFFDRLDGNVKGPLAANDSVVMLPQPVEMDGKTEIFGRLKKIELSLEK